MSIPRMCKQCGAWLDRDRVGDICGDATCRDLANMSAVSGASVAATEGDKGRNVERGMKMFNEIYATQKQEEDLKKHPTVGYWRDQAKRAQFVAQDLSLQLRDLREKEVRRLWQTAAEVEETTPKPDAPPIVKAACELRDWLVRNATKADAWEQRWSDFDKLSRAVSSAGHYPIDYTKTVTFRRIDLLKVLVRGADSESVAEARRAAELTKLRCACGSYTLNSDLVPIVAYGIYHRIASCSQNAAPGP